MIYMTHKHKEKFFKIHAYDIKLQHETIKMNIKCDKENSDKNRPYETNNGNDLP